MLTSLHVVKNNRKVLDKKIVFYGRSELCLCVYLITIECMNEWSFRCCTIAMISCPKSMRIPFTFMIKQLVNLYVEKKNK